MGSNNIVIIGPRKSGKTTYLAGLSYWQKLKDVLQEKRDYEIKALNDDASKLQDQAKNILLEGAFSPTVIPIEVFDLRLPSYSFRIEIKRRFSKTELNLVFKDYPGEIFDELNYSTRMSPWYREFWQEYLSPDVVGCLILLSRWQREECDRQYSRIVGNLTELIDEYKRMKNFRLAVAMSKCERIELWPGRLNSESDLFEVHLPRTRDILRRRIPKENLKFFAISSFGVLGENDPRPNRENRIIDGKFLSVLRDSEKWQPYNLIEPLYWLSTGQVIPVLNRKFPALFS